MTEAQNQIESARLLTVKAVAAMLTVSSRHVYRMVDSGKMPRPVKLGGSIRWDREVVENWIKESCPSVRHVKHVSRLGR